MKEERNKVGSGDMSEKMYRELRKKHSSRSSPKSTLAKLDKKNMFSILVYLKYNRPAIKTEIYSKVSRNSSMNGKLDTLEELGLIAMYSSPESPVTYVILTDKGERVVKMLEDMIDEIEKPEDYKPPEMYYYWKEKNRD